MNAVGILGIGAAAPGLRLPKHAVNAAWDRRGGRGQVAVCAADEDSLTLAWDAATSAIRAAGIPAATVAGLWWGTTTPPFADGPSHSVLAAALGIGPNGALCSGSSHAGVDALLGAADALAAGRADLAVVVASDALRPAPGTTYETRAGAGAVAFVLGVTAAPAKFGPVITRSRPLLDRYRGAGELDERDLYDGRLFREAIFLPLVGEVVDAARPVEVSDLASARWSLPDPDGRLGAALARDHGIADNTASPIYEALGDTGAAAALLGIAGALDSPTHAIAVAYGGGRASAVTIEVTDAVAGSHDVAVGFATGREVSYNRALRVRGQVVPGGETIAMGVPPESALFARGAEEMLQLLGARCDDCGTICTPPSIHPHCVACGGPKLEPVELARRGTVHTYVVNHTMPAPFEAPLPIAVIDLEDGARVMLQVDDDGEHIEIGTSVDLVLRKYAHERGVPVYGYKARPRKDAR